MLNRVSPFENASLIGSDGPPNAVCRGRFASTLPIVREAALAHSRVRPSGSLNRKAPILRMRASPPTRALPGTAAEQEHNGGALFDEADSSVERPQAI